jgi:hypothetical protein
MTVLAVVHVHRDFKAQTQVVSLRGGPFFHRNLLDFLVGCVMSKCIDHASDRETARRP